MEINDDPFVNYEPITQPVDSQSNDTATIGSSPSSNATPEKNEQVNDIRAIRGIIGGWNLTTAQLFNKDAKLSSEGFLELGTGDNIIRADAQDETYRLWIGNATASQAPFSVTIGGFLRATGATITGNFKAADRVYYYGDGADGALTATGATTLNATTTSIDAASATGQTVLNVTSTTGFTVGDHVFIHQTQGTGAGLWEIKAIESIQAGVSLTMTENLVNSYAATGAQCFEMKEYTSAVFKGAASIADTGWDGTSGGVVAFYASQGVLIENGTNIDVDALGFRGGAGSTGVSYQGEGEDGVGTQSTSANGVGASGQPDTGGTGSRGSGGALKETGEAGDAGAGGLNLIDATTVYTNGDGNLVLMFGGGGGGNHASAGGNERTGGAGGGILVIIAPFIWIGGSISANGANGTALGGGNDSGSGAGGVVALFSEQVFGASNITVAGGTTTVGNGGDGYIIQGVPGGLPTA